MIWRNASAGLIKFFRTADKMSFRFFNRAKSAKVRSCSWRRGGHKNDLLPSHLTGATLNSRRFSSRRFVRADPRRRRNRTFRSARRTVAKPSASVRRKQQKTPRTIANQASALFPFIKLISVNYKYDFHTVLLQHTADVVSLIHRTGTYLSIEKPARVVPKKDY